MKNKCEGKARKIVWTDRQTYRKAYLYVLYDDFTYEEFHFKELEALEMDDYDLFHYRKNYETKTKTLVDFINGREITYKKMTKDEVHKYLDKKIHEWIELITSKEQG